MTVVSDDDPHANLRRAAENKSARAMAAARRAIIALEARGAAINFKSVADEAGVSSGYLYGNPDLREAIASRRKTTPPAPVRPSRSSRESQDAGNATKVAALTSEVRRLRAENAQLRAENERLRGDLMERRSRP